jgi:hypothetical protein
MKLSTYIELAPTEEYDFDTFRRKLVSFGLRVNYDLADDNYIVKQEVEDPTFRKNLNYAIKNGVSPNILNLNGVVVNRKTNEIVCFGYETSREVLPAAELLRRRNGNFCGMVTEDEAQELLPAGLGTYPYITPNDLSKYTNDDVKCYQSMVDGILIRVYYDPSAETWRIGTGRSIDAAKSVWTGKSFSQLFLETGYWQLIMDAETLNKRHCYMFVFCHPGNQQVHRHKTIRLYHVLTRDLETLEEIDVDLGIQRMPAFPGQIEKPIDALSLMHDCTDTNQGIMIIMKNGLRIPIMSNEYNVINGLRGNYANLRCRILEILHMRNEQMEFDFGKNYPTFKAYISSAKKAYKELYEVLLKQIIQIKIRKSVAVTRQIPPSQLAMINSIWGQFKLHCRQQENLQKQTSAKTTQLPTPERVVVNGVTMLKNAQAPQEQTNNNQRQKITKEFIADQIHRLPVAQIWEMLNERPDVPHEDDWRD